MTSALPNAVKNAETDSDAALDAFSDAMQKAGENVVTPESVGGEPEAPAPDGSGETPATATPAESSAPAPTTDKPPSQETPVGDTGKPAGEGWSGSSDFKQKYQTLLGKYNAEVPRLHAAMSRLKEELATVKSAVTTAGPDTAAGKPASVKAVEEAILAALPQEQLAMLGPDAISTQATMIAAALEKTSGNVRAEVDQLKRDSELKTMRSFWDRVEQNYPGATTIDAEDPEWPVFLDSTEPVSGIPYREIGARAIAAGDAKRLVSLFQLYKPVGGETSREPARPVVVKPGQSAVSVGRTGSGKGNEARPVFRESDITKFYTDVANGKYRGDEARRVKIETEIEAAAAAGRVISG